MPEPRSPREVGLYVRSFHFDDSFGLGFEGDDRGFSTSPEATARIHAGVVVARQGAGFAVDRVGGRSDPSRHPILGQGTATPDISARARRGADGFTQLRLDNAAGVPLLPGAPDIDVHTTVELQDAGDRLHVRMAMRGDAFPNAEAFLRDHAGNAVFLGVHVLKIRQSPARLIGDGNAEMSRIELSVIRGDEGAFVGVEFDGRTYDLDTWNAIFEEAPTQVGVAPLDPAQDQPVPAPVSSPRE